MQAQLLHLVQHRNGVDGLGEIEHGVDGLIDLPVLLQVEVAGGHDAHHVGNTAAVDEDGAQNRLFRFQRLGRLLAEQLLIHVGFSFLSKVMRPPYSSSILTVRGALIS